VNIIRFCSSSTLLVNPLVNSSAIVEAHQEKLVQRIRGAHELHGRLARLIHLVGHAAAHVKNQADRDRHVLARQGYDLLLDAVFEDSRAKIDLFSEAGYQDRFSGIGDRDVHQGQNY
jgi:3-hydroxyacyl-CoA dehydrogenase